MNSTPTPPLVSVVVRTVGRESLSRALSSIGAQTYRPIEIVLVDAAATGLAMTRFGDLPVRVVANGKLDRPRAANAGLDAARGEWILLLDEDDQIERDHLAMLVATATVSGSLVAYSQTRLVAANGAERLLGGPFNREALRRSNYLAIHAVLFSRSLLAQGHRFDESLAIFEDWDFWVQLSARTPFAFTGKPTAIYRYASGESGAGGAANLDAAAALAQRERLLAKWGP